MSVSINLNTLLKAAITIARDRDNEDLSTEQIIKSVLSKVPLDELLAENAPVKSSKGKEDKQRKPRAPAKPRAVPEDDERCMARCFYEKDHLDEHGHLKVMRDDPENLYGDRCKSKKKNCDFCGTHTEKQSLGIWGADYSGKFKQYVEKTESESEKSSKSSGKVKSLSEKKAEKKAEEFKVPSDHEDEEDEDVERERLVALMKKKAEERKALEKLEKEAKKKQETTKPAPKIEEEVEENEEDGSAEVVEIEIDGEAFLIDESDGTVYDVDSQEIVGKYDVNKKAWKSRK